MKKEQLFHTIIYSTLLLTTITLTIILTLASCTGSPEAGEPGFHADKTPLTLGNIALAETGQPWTRQTSEEFFVEGDVLILAADAQVSGGSSKLTTFAYHPDAPGGNPWTLTGEPIYYEDVAENYTFRLAFGDPNLTDQSAGTHPADYILGFPTLNGPTITCDAMERQRTQINIVLTKGDDWGDTDFQQYLADCTFSTSGIIPFTTFDTNAQTLTFSVIIPLNPWTGFTLTTPAGRTQTLVLDEALDPQPGYAYTITAPYHLRGLLGTPTISITPWQKEGGNTELPGHGPETTAFLDWAAKVRTGVNLTLNHTLTADIDLTGIQWEPLPNYNGTFDGAGHTITGLTVNSEETCTALFPLTSATATIKNLTLNRARIHTTYNAGNDGRLGALVGENSGIIENCHVLNSNITGGIGFTGALAGGNFNGTILACTATNCTVQGGYIAGGITGYNGGNSTLIACHTNGGTVESTATRNDIVSYAGGIAGNVTDGTLTACYAAPTAITAYGQGVITHSVAGGVVGSAAPIYLTTNYWRSPTPGVTHGNGLDGGSNTNAEPTPDGLTPEVITAMNAAIDAYNAENANACQWKWSAEGIIPLD